MNKNNIYFASNDTSGGLDVILSPYYYWYFKQKLPVADKKTATKIAPEFFMSKIDNTKEYEYILIPTNEKNIFEVIIVNMGLFWENLKALGVEKSRILNVSFATKEFDEVKINLKDSLLVVSQNQAFELPISKNISIIDIKDDTIDNALSRKTKLDFTYRLSSGNIVESIIDIADNYYKSLIGIFLILSVAFMIDIVLSYQEIKSYNIKKLEALAGQKYAEHSIQLSYVKKNFEALDANEKKFRQELNNILKLPTNQNIYINKFYFENGLWRLDIIAQDRASADAFIAPLGASFAGENDKKFIYEMKK